MNHLLATTEWNNAFLAVTKSQSCKRCLMSDVCRPVVPNVMRNTKGTVYTGQTCFYSTSSQPMNEFHSCLCAKYMISILTPSPNCEIISRIHIYRVINL